jgi:AraC-like DNA-binding protein
MREIIRASAWGGFADLVRELGGDPEAIFAKLQLDPRLLEDAERYLPLKQFMDGQTLAAEQLNRPDFGLLIGQRQTISVLGALAIAILNSATPRQGIEIAARYLHVHNPAVTMSLDPTADPRQEFLTGRTQLRGPARHEQNNERIISSFHRVLQQIGGAAYRPRAVHFTHARIAPMQAYRKVFGIEPLFEQPAMGIVIDRDVLDAWRPGGSAQMRDVAEAFLLQQSLPNDKVYSKSVANMARSLLRGGEFAPPQVAKILGLHARTLQRRLHDEGTSFEKIKDDARREWAQSLLVQPAVSLTQIALMLGYADASAFSRSCRRWFGEAPRTYRARLTGGRRKSESPRLSRVNSLEANLRARRAAGV